MTTKKNGPPGEDDLIRQIQTIVGEPGECVVHGIGDDTAVLSNPGSSSHLLITTDMLVEDVHFNLAWSSPWQVGWKAVVASVSDIASMGGRPSSMVVSAGIKSKNRVVVVQQLVEGIAAAGAKYGVEIAGGDTVRSDKLVINIAMTGYVAAGKAILRSGARDGDILYVTGTCGDSVAGLDILSSKGKVYFSKAEKILTDRHVAPEANLEGGLAAAASGAVTAMMDLSDGLATDLVRLAARSECGAIINLEDIPVSRELRTWCGENNVDPFATALTGGEDFNLLMAVNPSGAMVLEEIMAATGNKITAIGKITSKRGELILKNKNNESLQWPDSGFKHF